MGVHVVKGAVRTSDWEKRFMDDQNNGGKEFKELRAKGEQPPIETTGRELRSLFSWISEASLDDYVDGSVAS